VGPVRRRAGPGGRLLGGLLLGGRLLGGLLLGGLLLGGLCLAVALPAGPAAAEPLRLPTASQAQQTTAALLVAVGARPDRALVSRVPGPATNDERVLVDLDGAGTATGVQLDQRIVLSGQGDFQVRERGPARTARALSPESAPVTKLGAVIWQGFTAGDPPRELAALLTLDPALERPRLPLSVTVTWTPAGGAPTALGPGGTVPGPGTVVVEVSARTSQPAVLPTALDAAPVGVAAGLDRARVAALAPPGPRLPAAEAGLAAAVEVTRPGSRQGAQAVPLRLTGSLLLTGAAGAAPASSAAPVVSGPGTTAVPGGALVSGTLGRSPARFEVHADGPGTLALDLTAVPALDARTLVPPGGAASWAAWAATGPGPVARRAALDLLVDVAATGARAAAFSPYLGADLPGTGSTSFHYAFAAAPVAAVVTAPLRPRPGALVATGVAALLVLGGAAALWRRS